MRRRLEAQKWQRGSATCGWPGGRSGCLLDERSRRAKRSRVESAPQPFCVGKHTSFTFTAFLHARKTARHSIPQCTALKTARHSIPPCNDKLLDKIPTSDMAAWHLPTWHTSARKHTWITLCARLLLRRELLWRPSRHAPCGRLYLRASLLAGVSTCGRLYLRTCTDTLDSIGSERPPPPPLAMGSAPPSLPSTTRLE